MSLSLDLDHLFVREFERKDDKIIRINQSGVGDVGCVVWDAAIVLASYLESDDFQDRDGVSRLQGKKVVELGAGTGLVGLQAACSGASCTITDLADFVPLMDLNISANYSIIKGHITARALNWGEDIKEVLPAPDFLLVADCIYYAASLEPLVTTIKELSSPSTCVLCCFEERTTGNKPELQQKFFELIERYFEIAEIPQEKQDPVFRSPDIHIMKFMKRTACKSSQFKVKAQ